MKTQELIKAVDSALRTTLSKVGLEDSNLKKKTQVITTNDAIEVIMPDYAINVDKGRKAGKNPPVKAIMQWLKDRKIRAPKGTRRIDLAYAIARSIGERGVKPRPFIDAFTEQLGKLVVKHIDKEIDNKLKDKK